MFAEGDVTDVVDDVQRASKSAELKATKAPRARGRVRIRPGHLMHVPRHFLVLGPWSLFLVLDPEEIAELDEDAVVEPL